MTLYQKTILRGMTGGIIATLLSSAAIAQAIANIPREKTLVVAHQTEAPNYRNVGMANPYSINNEDIRGSILNMFEPLFYYNSNKDELIPWLAESFEYNDDFTEVTLHLCDGVTWSDGEPFGANDVAFTYEMPRANGADKKDSRSGHQRHRGRRLGRGGRSEDREVHAGQARPAVRVQVPRQLLRHWLPDLARAHLEGRRGQGGVLELRRREGLAGHHRPLEAGAVHRHAGLHGPARRLWGSASGFTTLPEMERILTVPGGTRDRMAQLITAGQVDITGDIQVASVIKQIVTQSPNIRTYTGDQPPYGSKDWWPTSLYFNHLNPKWADARVRHAINYYVNRDQIIDVIYGGASEPKFTPFPSFGSLQPYIDAAKPLAEKYGIGVFDPGKGDALMTEAGFAKNGAGMWEKDGTVLSAQIETISVLDALAPVVAEQLRQAGIDASFRSTPESRSIMRDGKADLVLFGHRGSISDPYATLAMYTCENALPEGQPTLFVDRWCNEDFDKLVAQIGQLQPGDPKILDLTTQAMEIWMREAVEVPIQEWYHRIPMNNTVWTNWPSEENPYLQPAFWYTSGQFGYLLHQLHAAN